MNRKFAMLSLALLAFSLQAGAQEQNAPPQPNPSIYHVTMVGKTVTAINYQHRSSSTMIDFQGTPLLPPAKGQAKIDSEKGSIPIDAKFDSLQLSQMFGRD